MGSVLFAFLLIMVAGGLIAYFGDRLGYQMGKKRVTLFGLRPRHTATTLTVISGVVIGALTLALLIGVNKAFRIALIKGEQEIRTNLRLRKSNERLRLESNADKLLAADAERAATDADNESDSARRSLQEARYNLVDEQDKTKTVEKELNAKQVSLAQLSSSLLAARISLTEVEAQIAQVKQYNKEEMAVLKSGVVHRRGGTLIYRNLGELGRDVVSAADPTATIRANLVHFLDQLSQSAYDLGARKGANGRAVVITTLYLFDQQKQNSGDFVDENGSLDALADSIHARGSGSVVVVASALGNSFDGDQVILMLRPYADITAIKAGSQIAQTVINGASGSDDAIAGQLQRFLVADVRPAATRAGVIPVKNPQTGADELGEISFHQLYQTVTLIRQVGGPAVVTATVDRDVSSADQLKLIFSVKTASDAGTL